MTSQRKVMGRWAHDPRAKKRGKEPQSGLTSSTHAIILGFIIATFKGLKRVSEVSSRLNTSLQHRNMTVLGYFILFVLLLVGYILFTGKRPLDDNNSLDGRLYSDNPADDNYNPNLHDMNDD